MDLAIRDLDVERTKLWFDHPGPWLNLDVWVHLEGEHHFALWRATGAVYPVINNLGEVGEDPMILAVDTDEARFGNEPVVPAVWKGDK